MFGPPEKDATEKLDSPFSGVVSEFLLATIDAAIASVHIFVAIACVYFPPVLGSSFHTVFVFFCCSQGVVSDHHCRRSM
jgi:hypothetical protein